jgi:gliding motility-associated-like protein/uncharacterized repeat protein (TIGR01451 family)
MKFKNNFKILFVGVSLIFLNGFKTYSQQISEQIYASAASEIPESGSRVVDAGNAEGNNDASFARVNSGLSYSGELKLVFSELVPAYTTTYIKIDALGKGDLDKYLGGSLGDLLADAGGTASNGDHYVEVYALDNLGKEFERGSTANLSNDPNVDISPLIPTSIALKLVKNKDGELFITITPTKEYKAIVIKDITNTLVPEEISTPLEETIDFTNFTNVYSAFHIKNPSCNSDLVFTSFDGTGYTLDLLDLGVNGVKDLEFAIDNDPITFSTISVGAISAEASMYQDIYFSTTTTIGDILNFKIRPRKGQLVDVTLIEQNIKIELFNKKDQVVFTQTLDNLESNPILGIIDIDPTEDGEITEVTEIPEAEFNRFRVTLTSRVDVNLGQQVDLFEVKVTTPPPPITEEELEQSFCASDNPKVKDLKPNSTQPRTVIWYLNENGGDPLDPDTELINNKTYYAANLSGKCESIRISVVVNITTVPTPFAEDQAFCVYPSLKVKDLKPLGLTWYPSETGGDADNPEDFLKQRTYWGASVSDDGTCESKRVKVEVTIRDTPNPTVKLLNQTFCSIPTPTFGDLKPKGLIWYPSATGKDPYDNSDPLETRKYYAATESTDENCESSVRTIVNVTIIKPEKPTGSDKLYFCANDLPKKIKDLSPIGVIWYRTAGGSEAYASDTDLENEKIYYAASSSFDGACQSDDRLAVTVYITELGVPQGKDELLFCLIDVPKIKDLEPKGVIWYDEQSGGTAYKSTDDLVNDFHYYAASSDGTCESIDRLKVKVKISNPNPPTCQDTQTFCMSEAPTIRNLQADATGTITWYDQLTNGTAYAPEVALTDGLIYYASNSDGTCESSERFAVTVTISNPDAPSGNVKQSFCAADKPRIRNLIATGTGTEIIWYNQQTGGTAYSKTGFLVNDVIYYAANFDGSCESCVRLGVKVTISDAETPSGKNIQTFCNSEAATIADLKATASGVIIWYDQPTGGNEYADTDTLVNNLQYYAANFNGICQSSERFIVTVTFQNPETPTGIAERNFCKTEVATIADLNATTSASGEIVWYNLPTGGTAYNNTDTLINEFTYYATNLDETCESSKRFEVLVTFKNPGKPEGDAEQSFCGTQGLTIADLKATATGTIIWYDQPTGGTAYNSADTLVNKLKYYASSFKETCESSKRFEVLVTFNNPGKPEGNPNQSFCLINEPTITNLTATASNTVIWYKAKSGNEVYNDTDPLENGLKYYAANSDGSCESIERLEVAVVINNLDPATVTTRTQFFCAVENPTIADLKATASGTIMWYDQISRGNVYKDTDALVNNLKYYVANSDGTCESSERSEVSVVILDTNPPSGANPQTFCSTQGATIADLEATASGTITWYNKPMEGTAYANTDALANEFIYYAANSDGSCESSERFEVTVLITTATPISIEGKNTNVCFADIETYSVADGHAPYTWDISGGNLVSGGMPDDNEIEIEWTNITSAKVSVSLTGGCYSSNSAEQIVEIVVCSDLSIKKEVDFINPTVEDIITFKVEVENPDQARFEDVIISEVLPSGFTYESDTTSLGTYTPSNGIWNIPSLEGVKSATLTLKVKVNTTGDYLNRVTIIQSSPPGNNPDNDTAEVLVTPSCFKIYNIITPNGDGLNDNFVLSCVEDADIEIYDRYGSIVYKNQNYKNDWNGVANQRGKIISKGENLPDGTYFFILRFNDGSTENIKSYIQIKR